MTFDKEAFDKALVEFRAAVADAEEAIARGEITDPIEIRYVEGNRAALDRYDEEDGDDEELG